MVAIKALSVFAIAGVAVAAPAQVGSALEARNFDGPKNFGYNYHWNDNGDDTSDDTSDDTTSPSKTHGSRPNVVIETEEVVVTEYKTIPWGQKPPQQATPPPQPKPTKPASPAQPTGGQPWNDNPAPAPSGTPPSGPTEGGYIGIVNQYRAMMKLPSLSLDATLQANAEDTSAASGGELKHKLNEGSMAQVMAGGEPTDEDFIHVFAGGWLCEIPSLLPSTECAEHSVGWNYQGQTGHAEILTDLKYTKIGCGCASGMWTCDLS